MIGKGLILTQRKYFFIQSRAGFAWVLLRRTSLVFFISLTIIRFTFGQASTSSNVLRDTLDNKLDFSNFILTANGFLPVFTIITEPALGHFGIAAAPLFLKPKAAVDGRYVPPDMTLGLGMYTANNSWMVGGLRIASFPKAGIKYRVGAGYAQVNLDFYRTIVESEQKISVTMKTVPLLAQVSKRLAKTNVYLGLNYQFLNTTVSPESPANLPDIISDLEKDNKTSAVGPFLDWDQRDNVFTPDNGYRVNVAYNIDDDWTGSDFNFERLNAVVTWFVPFDSKWIFGLRGEYQQAFGSPPFYLLPGINMRGIPAVRYQGEKTLLFETEQRYDFTLRWSGVVFTGVARALPTANTFTSAETVFNVGGGFRYLVARIFKIRAGVDVAWGPDSFGYYIIFGHNWNR